MQIALTHAARLLRTLTLLALALVIVVAALLPSVRQKREVVFQGEDD